MDSADKKKLMKYTSGARVIVQTVTHNNALTIEACVLSVLRQRYKNLLFIVIDNGSTDGTPAIAKRLGIEVITLMKNIGYSAAHNVGIKRFKSDYVLTLNPDITLRPDFVGNLVKVMDGVRHDVGSAQALLYRTERMGVRSDIVDSAGLYMNPSRRQNLRYAERKMVQCALKREKIFGPDGAAAFYRRTMLRDIDLGDGVFDEDYFMHKEDVDVCWRAQLRGWKSILVPEAVGYHIRTFRPGQRTTIDPGLRMMAVRNRYYLLIKNDTPLLWLRDLPHIALYDFGIFFYIVFCERPSLRAYGDVIKNFRAMFIKRGRIHRQRKVGAAYMAQWFRRRHHEEA